MVHIHVEKLIAQSRKGIKCELPVPSLDLSMSRLLLMRLIFML